MNKVAKRLFATLLAGALCATTLAFGGSFRSEAATGNYVSNKDTGSKKGLQIDFNIVSDVEDLGISEAFFNIELEKLLEKDPSTASPGSMYDISYGGEVFHLHQETVEAYDMAVKRLTGMGANVTVAFVNNEYDPDHFAYMYYLGGGQDPSKTAYFAFNTTEGSQGQKTIQAVCDFVTKRYNGGEFGKINNFVIGNEINDNTTYNNCGPMDIDTYVGVYYQTFKTFYDAIKANNSTAQVYIPLECQWAGSIINSDEAYRGKDFLEKFNAMAKPAGVDWNLAYHPYSNPILSANVLRDNESSTNAEGVATAAGEVTDDVNTTFITMKNLDVLTSFMGEADMLNGAGNVRSIILSEQGYSSKSNLGDSDEVSQAANIAYAYYKAEMNPYIDAFILYEHVTIADRLNGSNFEFGLWNSDSNNNPTTKKAAYSMYKYIDTDRSADATAFALNYFGIDSWGTVIDNYDISKIYAYGKTVTNGSLYLNDAFDFGQGLVVSQDWSNGSGVDANGNAIRIDKNGNEDRTSLAGVTIIQSEFVGVWTPEYAVSTTFTQADYGNNGEGYQLYHPHGAIATDPKAYYINYQGVKYDPTGAIDVSDAPFLGFEFLVIPKSSADTSVLEIRVRAKSNEHIYDANALIPQDKFYNFSFNEASQKRFAGSFFVDLSGWAYKNSITEVEVWIRDTSNTSSSFDGVFCVQNLMKKGSGDGLTNLSVAENTNLGAIAPGAFNEVTTYCGVDYKAEYDKDLYTALYPELAEAGIDDPYEVIEHYATVGKAERRIGNMETVCTVPGGKIMYRLYNPNTGEHFYTSSKGETLNVYKAGWNFEGTAWIAPIEETSKPVYRLYNANGSEHHYTTYKSERDNLISLGWKDEGIGWYSVDESIGVPLYRLYNPNEFSNNHHYTRYAGEKNNLISIGWQDENIAWYGLPQ